MGAQERGGMEVAPSLPTKIGGGSDVTGIHSVTGCLLAQAAAPWEGVRALKLLWEGASGTPVSMLGSGSRTRR